MHTFTTSRKTSSSLYLDDFYYYSLIIILSINLIKLDFYEMFNNLVLISLIGIFLIKSLTKQLHGKFICMIALIGVYFLFKKICINSSIMYLEIPFSVIITCTFIFKKYKEYIRKTFTVFQIKTINNALKLKCRSTLKHSQNVAYYTKELTRTMSLTNYEKEVIYFGALMHDIGKLSISDEILLKENVLTEEEYQQMKSHTTNGYNMIKQITYFNETGISDIILFHHERFDGKGYPAGLKGEEIPLGARIVAVADAFDAMTNKRVYSTPLNYEDAFKELNINRGTQFDPDIVDTFIAVFK